MPRPKRLLDVTVSALLLVLLAPVVAVVALAYALDVALSKRDRGGLLYSEPRISRGREFGLLKFRTLRADVLERAAGHARLLEVEPANLTWLGRRVLKPWYLDELPQLWNVLRGEMSLVGPRPFFEADLEAYEDHHFRRLSAKPGITGLWQVSGRSDLSYEDRVRLDMHYIRNHSIWLDLQILFRTIPVLLLGSGAY